MTFEMPGMATYHPLNHVRPLGTISYDIPRETLFKKEMLSHAYRLTRLCFAPTNTCQVYIYDAFASRSLLLVHGNNCLWKGGYAESYTLCVTTTLLRVCS